MTPIEQIKAEIERRLKNEHITFHARNELLNLLSFIELLEKKEAPKRRLRDVPSWIAEVKAERGHEDEILQKSLEELRRIRAEKNRLNEAAFTYENDLWESGFKDSGYSPQEVNDAFKAEAEWMAGQGVSYEDTISSDKTIPILPMKDVSDMGLDYGDKVIVQIRKKQ